MPKFKKLFDKGKKKKGASEVCKSFEKSKESLQKEIEEKTPDLQPKVVEIYRSSTVITQKLFKEPNETAVKDNPDAAQSALDELAKAGFPGAQDLSDAGTKFGPALLPGPIVFVLQKTSTFLTEEPMPEVKEETREVAVESVEPASTAEPTKTEEPPADIPAGGEPEVAKEGDAPATVGVEGKTEGEAPAHPEPVKPAEVTTPEAKTDA